VVDGEPPRDQGLVIAKYKKKYLARRLLRDKSDSLFSSEIRSVDTAREIVGVIYEG
jgi:hypothetical protein